ncbi:MAG: amidohydrolase [Actinobacteria bacterium]|nr:amidohydrolase [Actinomycetota bacterium]MCL5445520.1 amidohydrolase [Actinomycetota bacterium]
MDDNEKVQEESLKPVWVEKAKLSYHTVEKLGDTGNITEADVAPVLKGAIDIHVHGYPDALVDTGWDFAEICRSAYDASMRAICCKSMHSDTAPMAYFVQQIIDNYARDTGRTPGRFKVFGGVVLNYAVGGLNPRAVKTSLKLGGKCVWMPSHDAAHHRRVLGESGGIEVLSNDGELLPEMYEIFDLIAEYGAILDTCHLGTRERFAVIKEARKAGVERILITHPQWSVNRASIDQQAEMANLGAYVGLFMYSAVPHFNNPVCDREEFLEIIKTVGPDKIVLSTDYGSMLNPPPVEAMKLYIRLLLAHGVPRDDIDTMLKRNPAWLLGLDDDPFDDGDAG